MGTSPQEEMANEQHNRFNNLSEQFQSGNLSAGSQFAKIDPMFKQIIDVLNKQFGQVKTGIQTQVGQNVGESLVTSGVAPGHDRGGAWATAISGALNPALQQLQGLTQQTGQARAMTYADLLEKQNMNIMAALTGGLQAIGMTKDSTTTGDILGGVTSLGNIFSSLFGAGGGAGGTMRARGGYGST